LSASFPEVFLMIEKKDRSINKRLGILHFHSVSFLLQEPPGVVEKTHVTGATLSLLIKRGI
jgi:hypothetical protein